MNPVYAELGHTKCLSMCTLSTLMSVCDNVPSNAHTMQYQIIDQYYPATMIASILTGRAPWAPSSIPAFLSGLALSTSAFCLRLSSFSASATSFLWRSCSCLQRSPSAALASWSLRSMSAVATGCSSSESRSITPGGSGGACAQISTGPVQTLTFSKVSVLCRI